MVTFPALRIVAVLVLLTPIAAGAALSAALVGETGRVEVAPVPEQPLDQIKAGYRRPDTIRLRKRSGATVIVSRPTTS
jgi:hypothetical protein